MNAKAQAATQRYLRRVGPKTANALYSYYTAPASTAATTGATTGASAYGSSGVGMTTAGWASVAAPLLMAYMAYTAGSGQNTPLRLKGETMGSAKLIKDLLGGQKVDKNDYWSKYRLQPKYTKDWSIGADQPGWNPPEAEDYGIGELWHRMHYMGKGGNYDVNSSLTDADIDSLFGELGVDSGQLAKSLGLDAMPDWNSQNYSDWFKNQDFTNNQNTDIKITEQDRATQDELRRLLYGG